MEFEKIKVFNINDVDSVTGLDEESTKKWYAFNVGIEIDDIETIEEITDLENEGFWVKDLVLSEVIAEFEISEPDKVTKIMKIDEGSYAAWTSFRDYIMKTYVNREFENEIIASTEY